jgi:2-amino-4-hydroxy-6-hydroxymethyldihydropteridine diphosphokinase
MTLAAIAFGSNLGLRERHLADALAALGKEVELVAVSSAYETAPMYVEDQPPFLNGALLARTDLGPRELLRLLKRIEAQVGRQPAQRFGPREIDLDLLSYGRLHYHFADRGEPLLSIPHPRIPERRFVLEPLAEIAPDLVLPGLGTVSALLAATHSQADSVRRVEHAVLPILNN